MPGVKDCESRLYAAAVSYSRNSDIDFVRDELKRAAIAYARAKKQSLDNRDRWKQKNRLGE